MKRKLVRGSLKSFRAQGPASSEPVPAWTVVSGTDRIDGFYWYRFGCQKPEEIRCLPRPSQHRQRQRQSLPASPWLTNRGASREGSTTFSRVSRWRSASWRTSYAAASVRSSSETTTHSLVGGEPVVGAPRCRSTGWQNGSVVGGHGPTAGPEPALHHGSASSASPSSTRSTAARFSSRCWSEAVPGMSSTFGARWSSQARAI